MNIKIDFDNIKVKETRNDFTVKLLMLKGEKGEQGDLNHNDIVDNLTSTDNTKVLSAKQGKVLKNLVDKKPYYFNNVAEMKTDDTLNDGMVVQTLGYYSAGDGGGATYKIRTKTQNDTINDTSIIELNDENIVAILNEKFNVTVEMFGAYGDGIHDDYQAIQNAIDYIDGGSVTLNPKTYLVGDTLVIHRGLKLYGNSSYDSSNATLKLKDNTNKPILDTPNSSGTGTSTHYMIIENIFFDGNSTNQTEETTIIRFHGAFIGSIIRNISIRNFYGTALSIQVSDCQLDNIWIQGGYTLTNKYAFHINPTISSPEIYSMINGNNIYIENYSNKLNGNPRTNEEDRADGMMIYRVASLNLNEVHFESCKTPITSTGDNVIRLNMIRTAHCGLSTDNYSAFVLLTSAPRLMTLTNVFSTTNSVYSYWVYRNFSNNDIPQAPKDDNLTLASYTTEYSTENTPSYSQKTYFSNEVFANKVGQYSTPKIGVNSSVGYSYLRQSGEYTELGTNINQTSPKNFLRIVSTGGGGDNINTFAPIKLSERENAVSIPMYSIYITNNGTEAFPTYQRTTGALISRFATTRITTEAPSTNALYVGELWLNKNTKKLYIATSVGNGADDWTILN